MIASTSRILPETQFEISAHKLFYTPPWDLKVLNLRFHRLPFDLKVQRFWFHSNYSTLFDLQVPPYRLAQKSLIESLASLCRLKIPKSFECAFFEEGILRPLPPRRAAPLRPRASNKDIAGCAGESRQPGRMRRRAMASLAPAELQDIEQECFAGLPL